jgi:hypothetical protein
MLSEPTPAGPPAPPDPERARAGAAGRPDGYGLVLLLLLITYAVLVGETSSPWTASAVIMVQIFTVWVTLRVAHAARPIRIVADVTLVMAGLFAAANLLAHERIGVTVLLPLMSGLLYLVAPIAIVRHLLSRGTVDRATVLGAIDVYLLIGMFFAFVYRMVSIAQAGAFFGSAGEGTFAQILFFSFTTLTTTGYGNLVPADNPGQTLAVMEMLTGQLFLVTAVAKAINAFPAFIHHEKPPS